MVRHLPSDVRFLVAKALLVAGEFSYDVIKVAYDESHVYLLSYPEFDVDPHPTLRYSVKVILSSGQYCISDFTKSAHPHPPTLQRKDILVSQGYPLYERFKAFVEAEEKPC